MQNETNLPNDLHHDFEWLQLRHTLKEKMNLHQLPDLNAVLLLVGIQTLGKVQANFTKEQKQDLMHIAVCSLLEPDGHFEYLGRDADDWPHFRAIAGVGIQGEAAQQQLLIAKCLAYFSVVFEN